MLERFTAETQRPLSRDRQGAEPLPYARGTLRLGGEKGTL